MSVWLNFDLAGHLKELGLNPWYTVSLIQLFYFQTRWGTVGWGSFELAVMIICVSTVFVLGPSVYVV